MAYENIIVSDRGEVRTLTINRPKVLNALNTQVFSELYTALKNLETDKSIKAAIITGSGEKAFVAGADIAAMKNFTPLQAEEFSAVGHEVMNLIENLRIPVIAAVNGFALGGGLELALACDFIYASDNAQFGLVESKLGLIPGFGGIARLARRVGIAQARELVYSAKIIKSDDALKIGLVNQVCDAEELLNVASKIASKIAANGPVALKYAKKLLLQGEGSDLATANRLEQHTFGLMFSTTDASEGIGAFIEKRKALFQGA